MWNEQPPYENYASHLIERIKSRTVERENGCVEYVGNPAHKYGLVSITIAGKRKSIPPHRAMFMAVHKQFYWPRYLQVCHTCDNPRCVNVAHLFLGTAADNMRDCIAKGRRAKKHRPHTRKRKLTDEDVAAIRLSKDKLIYIADEYGISISHASRIRNGTRKQLVG